MLRIAHIVSFVAAILSATYAKAQQGFGIEANMLCGKVFRHEAKFTVPIPAITLGGDVNLTWRTYGRKDWQQRRHYPRVGIAAAGINYGINNVYGTVYSLYPNITFRLLSGKNLEWTLRFGNGIGYVTNKYNPITNTVNVAISASLNDFIMIRSDAAYTINRHWALSAGAFVTHISNGSVRKPNLGVNVAGISAGVSYYPVTSRPALIVHELKPLPVRYLAQARYGMSFVSAYTNGGPLYPVYIGTAYLSRRWHSHNKVFAGVDASYHPSTVAFLRNNGLQPGKEVQQSYKTAIIAGNEFLMGRVGILLQAGAYISKSYIHREDIYQKVTLNYYSVQRETGPIKEAFFYIGLKSHLNVAEFGELGIGIGF